MTLTVYLAHSWLDPRLRLNPENLNKSRTNLPVEWTDHIWKPDTYFKNAKDVKFQTLMVPNQYLWLMKDQKIMYMTRYPTTTVLFRYTYRY